MRLRTWWICGAVLAACGNSADKPPPTPTGMGSGDEDPRCDPTKPRVCLADDVVACESNGRLGRRLRACHHGCERGKCKGTCSDEAVKLIYLVDSANELLSFDPRLLPKDPFRVIGKLTCEIGSPFSMSVDRNGFAWVVYDDGEMFKVDITDAHCEPAGYRAGSSGSTTFGMGFTTDTPGSDTEKLFIAADDSSKALHAVDTSAKDIVPQRVGTIAAATTPNPELTGGSDAKLFGFYPLEAGTAFVQEIDRTSGNALGPQWPLGSAPLGDVTAYAFARWAGVFYIFVTTMTDFESDSTVRTLDPATGSYKIIRSRLPFRITGAGVSTCAPERDAKSP